MAVHETWAFDINRVGDLGVEIRDAASANPFQTSLTSGKYAYYDISGVSGVDQTDFATALASALNAAKTGAYAASFTVTAVTAVGGPAYEVEYDSGNTNVELNFSAATTAADGTRLRRLLGFSADQTGAATYTSDVRPYYVIVPQIAGRAPPFDGNFYPQGGVSAAIADSGASYAVARSTLPVLQDWQHQHELLAGVFIENAPDGTTAADVPWTWEHAWLHASAIEPFVLTDGSAQTVHKFHEDAATLAREARRQVWPALDTNWHITLRTRKLGTL